MAWRRHFSLSVGVRMVAGRSFDKPKMKKKDGRCETEDGEGTETGVRNQNPEGVAQQFENLTQKRNRNYKLKTEYPALIHPRLSSLGSCSAIS
jgi:hypothetical protein